jgi:serine/threonine protein kinase
MAWIDGTDLKKRIANLNRPLSLAEASKVLEPLSSALNFAHKKGIYHCDIKPSNILLHENGREVFLADFGVARVVHEQGGGGTFPYMAPEQFTHERVSAQTDVYALGITLYEILSGGIQPYRGTTGTPGSTTRDRFAYEHSYSSLPSITQFNSSLPQSIISVLQRALNKNPADRFKSTLDFYNAFEQTRRDLRTSEPEYQTIYEPPSQPVKPPEAPPAKHETPLHQPPVQPRSVTPLKKGIPHLFVRSGDLLGQSIPISSGSELMIGRGTACQVRLQERSVSRKHATIFLTKRGAYVRDEGSSLGTFLNNQRIPPNVPIPVKQGDVIQIGYYQVFELRIK